MTKNVASLCQIWGVIWHGCIQSQNYPVSWHVAFSVTSRQFIQNSCVYMCMCECVKCVCFTNNTSCSCCHWLKKKFACLLCFLYQLYCIFITCENMFWWIKGKIVMKAVYEHCFIIIVDRNLHISGHYVLYMLCLCVFCLLFSSFTLCDLCGKWNCLGVFMQSIVCFIFNLQDLSCFIGWVQLLILSLCWHQVEHLLLSSHRPLQFEDTLLTWSGFQLPPPHEASTVGVCIMCTAFSTLQSLVEDECFGCHSTEQQLGWFCYHIISQCF